MRIHAAIILSLSLAISLAFSISCAQDAEFDETDDRAGAGGKADDARCSSSNWTGFCTAGVSAKPLAEGCFDFEGFEGFCSLDAEVVFDTMDVEDESTEMWPGGIVTSRDGTFQGREARCLKAFDPIQFDCTFPVFESDEAVLQWAKFGNHADVDSSIERESRRELTDWFTGEPTGNTRIRSTRRVDAAYCHARADFVGFTDEIMLDQSAGDCQIAILHFL